MAEIKRGLVRSVHRLNSEMYLMTVESANTSQNALPGQFVNVKCCEGLDAYLRRPISICNVNKKENTFDLGIQVKGKGTELLCKTCINQEIDFLGPLGKGFTINPSYKRIAVIGGGIGIFPLVLLLNAIGLKDTFTYLGFRSKEQVVLEDEFNRISKSVVLTTEDGSRGVKGFVTGPFEKDIENAGFDMVYTCGPIPMMKAVSDICRRYSASCQVSMEQRMGCGIGACLVCACKIKAAGGWDYAHVCKDGPVFMSDRIEWE